MAVLHKFRDDTRTREDRIKPIRAKHLDDNFTTVRLKLSDSVQSFLKIVETPGAADMLDFVVQPPSAESVPVFSGGVFSEWKLTGECS